jgi:E1A-binding protein p400
VGSAGSGGGALDTAHLLPKTFELAVGRSDDRADFMAKEMAWMSADFENERKRHVAHARKRGRQLLAHFKSRESAGARHAKDEQLLLRKLAAKQARDVKSFWGKINKIVAYKQRVEMEEVPCVCA